MDNRSISDRIMLEDVPSDRYYLDVITTAMRENRQISIDYEDFFGNTIQGLKINPYFIRLFKRRWYVLALVPQDKVIHRFGLDRIKSIEALATKFKYPKSFSPEGYFQDFYGASPRDKHLGRLYTHAPATTHNNGTQALYEGITFEKD